MFVFITAEKQKNIIIVLKIGILTFHRCINYGSYWQSRQLAEALQARGHSAELLDHFSARVNMAEWRCALQPVLPTPVPALDKPLYREKIEKFFEAFKSLPLSSAFPLDNPSLMEKYNLVVVGSDEVWNLSHPWYGHYPIFYGDRIRAEKLIAYAVSFGNYDVNWRLHPEWANRLSHFDTISVRDENSRIIINNTLGFEPPVVLDPCLQFPVKAQNNKTPYTGTTYAAVYGHNFTGSFIRKIKEWANDKHIPLISIGYRNDWADAQWITADPFEFADFIAQSASVITNFFHGCVFSFINSKPFVCESSPYRSNKISDLMRKTRSGHHLIYEDTPASEIYLLLEQPLKKQVLEAITSLRKTSGEWLDSALVLNTPHCYEIV